MPHAWGTFGEPIQAKHSSLLSTTCVVRHVATHTCASKHSHVATFPCSMGNWRQGACAYDAPGRGSDSLSGRASLALHPRGALRPAVAGDVGQHSHKRAGQRGSERAHGGSAGAWRPASVCLTRAVA
eukprot:1749756-Prymnesium_polylepis.1